MSEVHISNGSAVRRDDAPEIEIPATRGLRGLVKSGLAQMMEVPALGSVVRALAAEQTLFSNFRTDQLTYYAFERLLRPDSCCIDAGAHSGEITNQMLHFAPQGEHWAFEPQTEFVAKLRTRFAAQERLHIIPAAISDKAGTSEFFAVTTSPGLSGFSNRKYVGLDPATERREVPVVTLDETLPAGTRVDLMKMDIEGAELQALRGATRILGEQSPTLLLEFQQRGAAYFGYGPAEMFSFLTQQGYHVWSLGGWTDGTPALRLNQLWDCFENDPGLYLICQKQATKT